MLNSLGIISMNEIRFAIIDLDASIAHNTDFPGGELHHREQNNVQGVVEAMIKFGGETQIQLRAPINKESAIAEFS